LVVDPNAVLALSVALQGLEAIAGQCREILQRVCRLDAIQLETGGTVDARQRLDAFPGGEVRRAPVAIADDHSVHDAMKYALRHA
jgi:hypothetical protein